ncbi:MAG: acetyltransferase [Candidatus Omnitrophica bacterium]|nr:acetyltransferase [Candidatus Omnitrophota bacterium]
MRSLKSLYLWGAGDGALWTLDLLMDIQNADPQFTFEIAGLIADDFPKYPLLEKYPFIHRKAPDWKTKIKPDAAAVITSGTPQIRQLFYREIAELGMDFPVLIHPSAVISKHAVIKAGCLVGAQTIIAADVTLEENCFINYQCAMGHSSKLGRHSVLSSGTQIGGNVLCGEEILTGMNAVLLPRIEIGNGSEISAGALVTQSLEPGTKVMAPLPRKIRFS